MLKLAFLLLAVTGTLAQPDIGKGPFNPRAYTKKVAKCPAVNRAEEKKVEIDIHYADINPTAERTLLLVHGWPSLWSSWKYQIQDLQDEYRLIVPDQRGFGASTHPGDVKTSGTMIDLAGDLTCVLANAGVHNAICIGHDWGSQVCYEAGRERPDIFTALVGAALPYMPPAGPFVPIAALVPSFPHLAYQVFLDTTPDAAAAELRADTRRFLRGTLRDVASPPPPKFLTYTDSFMKGWDGVDPIAPIPFFTPDEEDYWVEQYEMQNLVNTLQFYSTANRKIYHDYAVAQANQTLPQPVLTVLPNDDPVFDGPTVVRLLHTEDYVPNLTIETMPGAHWLHLEHPDRFNKILRKWLAGIEKSANGTGSKAEETKGAHDEL
ncbi:alpha/beta-hydrolase [Dentipellis sp. KUC8613]|nr:alpha/beta-hydrolase [Dentipellis sp. KUC8613]